MGESPSIGCRRRGFLYAFSGIRGAEFLKKCDCKSIQMDSKTPGGFSTRVPGYLAHKWNIKSNNWRMKPKLRQKFHSSGRCPTQERERWNAEASGRAFGKSEAVG